MAKNILPPCLLSLCWLVLTTLAPAAPGDVDVTFKGRAYGPIRSGQSVRATAVQPDGKIVIGGYFFDVNEDIRPFITRLNPDGSRDTPFETRIPIEPQAIAVLNDGKLLVAGAFASTDTTISKNTLYRLLPDSTIDTSFTPEILGGSINSILVYPNGRIMIGGTFLTVAGVARPYLARLEADGTLDESFNPSINARVYGMALQPDEKILIGGSFSWTRADTQVQRGIGRLNADGSVDSSFIATSSIVNNTVDPVTAFAFQPNGKVVIGGFFGRINGITRSRLAVLNTDGSLDSSAVYLNDTVLSIGAQADGRFIIGGDFYNFASQVPYNGIARIESTATLDSTFARNPLRTVSGVTLQNDGRVFLGLNRRGLQSSTAPNLITRLENSPASETLTTTGGTTINWLRGGSSPAVAYTTFELSTDAGVTWTHLGSGIRVTGGWEMNGLSLPASGLVRARGRTYSGHYNGSSGLVEQVCSLDLTTPQMVIEDPAGAVLPSTNASFDFLNERFVAKTFKVRNTGLAPLSLKSLRCPSSLIILETSGLPGLLWPGQEASFTATFRPSRPEALSSSFEIHSNDPNTPIFSVHLSGQGALGRNTNIKNVYAQLSNPYSSPNYTDSTVSPVRKLYTISLPYKAYSLALRLETEDHVDQINSNGTPLSKKSYETEYYELPIIFTGNIQTVDLEVVALDGVTKQTYRILLARRPPIAGDLDFAYASDAAQHKTHSSLSITPDGSLVSPSTTEPYLKKINATGALESAFNPDFLSSDQVNGIQQLDNGDYLIFGNLSLFNGSYRTPVALLNREGQLLPDFRPMGVASSEVFCALRQPDGKILVGGENLAIPGKSLGRLIRFLPDGSLDSDFRPNFNGLVEALALDDSGHIVVGGSFTEVNGASASYLVRLNIDGSKHIEEPINFVYGSSGVSIIERAASGKWMIAGNFAIIAGTFRSGLARLNADWTLDPEFSSAEGYPKSIALQADGSLWMTQNNYNLPLVQLNSTGTRLASPKITGYVPYNLALTQNGQVMLNGHFSEINDIPREGLSRLHNVPATQELTVPNASRIQWLRGGSSPEARRVFFELSTDQGGTWTKLSEGTRITGGWEATGLHLPQAGRIRARAVVGSGYNNKSSGLVETISPDFQFAAPAMVVQVDDETLPSGAEVAFDEVGLKTGVETRTLQLTNTGGSSLLNIRAQLTGAAANQFLIRSQPSTELFPEDGSTVIVEFRPTKAGDKSATLEIVSNDPTTPVFSLNLTGSGTKAILSKVTTLAVADLTGASVTLKGVVDPQGAAQTVIFEYGLTAQLGQQVVAQPGTIAEGEGATEVQAALTTLSPHTRYFYRIRSSGTLGSAAGKILTFTTLNAVPVGAPDQFIVVYGSNGRLPVLSNDQDPDGDAFSLNTVSALIPSEVGSVRKVGEEIVFTANNPFHAVPASFTYTLKDAWGGVSAPVEVNIFQNEAILSGPSNVSAVAQTLYINVRTEGIWSVTQAPAWLRPLQSAGAGNGSAIFDLQANVGKTSRTGVIKIGHSFFTLIQSAAAVPEGPPIIFAPDELYPVARVARYFELFFPTQNLPAIFTVKNLPPGLTIDHEGWIRGIPTKAGRYDLQIQARNAAGSSVATNSFTLEVEPLSEALIGAYEGYFVPSNPEDLGLSGRYQFQVTPSGSYTGKIFFGSKSVPMKGLIESASNETGSFTIRQRFQSAATVADRVQLNVTPTGVVMTLDSEYSAPPPITNQGWKIPWNGKDVQAAAYVGLHTFKISSGAFIAYLPRGDGFGSVSITAKTGAARLVGRLPDGTAFTTATFAGAASGSNQQSQVLLYQSLYKDRGFFGGVLTLVPGTTPAENTVYGNAVWVKQPVDPKTKDVVYPQGIRHPYLILSGSALPRVAAGGVVMGVPNGTPQNAELRFQYGGLAAEETLAVTLSNPSAKGVTQKAVVLAGENATATLPKVDATTGLFNGELSLPGPVKALDRKVAFMGQLVRIGTETRGYGFFLLPQLPAEGETLKTAPQLSGQVILSPAEGEE
ncbi:choice-of-anchor D domain-containing protein [Prosthecobacter dejongeii]|uniref:Putative delta-60 repeat protein n=1 Tax=Prosthecobacter dejongeii TaxID=48465 RepID=A0A7W8DQW6_9BACT|nr:choice-of-anchor D domain-containing protein [Prosthecobacter dejongeii]MBB5038807.1 putative delta-60 repeat protein [Prosthecobacter dejongeii]